MASRRYSTEFKREAVRRTGQPGASTASVAQDLRIHANLLHRWMRELAPSKDGRAHDGNASSSLLVRENLRLSNELEVRNRQLIQAFEQQTATREILRVISSSPVDLASVFEAVAKSVSRLCDVPDVVILRAEGGVMRFAASVGPFGQTIGRDLAIPITRGTVAGRGALERRTIQVPDLAAESDDEYPEGKALQRRYGYRTIVAAPLLLGDTAVGAITMLRTEVRPFSDKQIALLRAFADQAVIAIQNARLFNETKEALEQQTATSEILGVIAGSPTELQPVLDTVARNAARLCEAGNASLYRVEGDRMRRVAGHGPVPASLRVGETRALSRGSMSGRAILDRHTLHVPDLLETDLAREFPDIKGAVEDQGVRTCLATPLNREGAPIGALTIYRTEVRPFTAKQIELVKTFADQAAIAVENARLFQELQARNRELTEALEQQTATAEILRVINSSRTDAEPVFETIIRNAVRLGGADIGSFIRVEDGKFEIRAHYNFDLRMLECFRAAFPHRVSRGTPYGHAIVDRITVNVPDLTVADYSAASKERAAALGLRAVLAVPLMLGDTAVGAITISRRERGAFSDAHVALLKTFADQAAIAIENARLFQELQARNRELTESLEQQTATAEILRVISSSPTDIQPVLDAIVRSGIHLFQATGVGLRLVKEDRLERAAFAVGPDSEVIEDSMMFPLPLDDRNFPGRAVLRREVIHAPDVFAEDWPSEESRKVAERMGIRAVAAAPLLRGNRALGAITVAGAKPRPFSEKEIALLRIFADQAVIAIENTRLFQELQARNRELTEALEQQTAIAEILRVISNSPADVQPVLDAVASTAARLCDADNALIRRIDGDALRRVATYGPILNLVLGEDIPIDRGSLTGRSVLDGQTIHIRDVAAADESEFPVARGLARRCGYRTVLVTPLLRKGVPLGAIGVFRMEVRPFSEQQAKVLETFADQAAIAIESARLFTELQSRTRELARSVEELQALGEVGRAVSSTLDLENVLRTIVVRALELAGASGGSIFEYDEATEQFRLRTIYGAEDELADLTRAAPLRLGEGITGRAGATRAPVQVPDILDERAYEVVRFRNLMGRLGYRSMISVPFLREDRLLGALTVWRRQVGEFSPDVVNLLQTFASQSTLAIQNARLFRELEEKSRELELANQAKSRFLAAASHDLRQPVNALALFVGQLQGRLRGGAGPSNLTVLAQRIGDSVDAFQQLLDALLDISKLDAGAVVPEREVFSLQLLLQPMAEDFAPSAAAKGLELRVQPTSLWVESDPLLLGRIVMNLLSNAVRYTESGRIVLGCRRRGADVEILVADSGIGIAEEELTHIFKEFYQIEPPTQGRTRALGLGLAIVERLARLLGHALAVRSRLGRGSEFGVRVPMAAPQLETAVVSRVVEPGTDLAGVRVLVVDDEAQEREALGGLLAQWGCEVRAAADGDEALATVEARGAPPDLVLCDLQLRGDETGFGLLDRLRARWGDEVPCAIITGSSAPDLPREAQSRGYSLLRKPTKPTTLRTFVEHVLRERGQRAE